MPDQDTPSTGLSGSRYVVAVVLLAGLATVPLVTVLAAGQAALDRSAPAPVVADHPLPPSDRDVTVVVPAEPPSADGRTGPAVPVSRAEPPAVPPCP